MIKEKINITDLFNENADYLFSFAITRVNDSHVAEDLVQETSLSAIKSADTFQGKSKASTWSTAILKNKIIDHYRKKVRELHKESIDELQITESYFSADGKWRKNQMPKDWDINYKDSIDQQEFYDIFQKCLGRLKEIQRMAFVMKHMEDLDTDDICKELNITASNYWVIMHRAKLQLRKCMETNWFNS
ncbi:MAG: sigma-70 family RNA polymerase sigma factor [Bacteroidales bacterium]